MPECVAAMSDMRRQQPQVRSWRHEGRFASRGNETPARHPLWISNFAAVFLSPKRITPPSHPSRPDRSTPRAPSACLPHVGLVIPRCKTPAICHIVELDPPFTSSRTLRIRPLPRDGRSLLDRDRAFFAEES